MKLSHANRTGGITLRGVGKGVTYLCKCKACAEDECGELGPVIQIGHPGLPGESHSTLHGTLANRIEGMTILGAELGVFIVNANGVQFSRVEISARKYDKGDMNAAMILANGFDHTFNHVSFWGFQADYVDCYKGGLHAAHPKCHGAPSVILRGVGPPGAAHFPVGGHSPPFRTRTGHNSSGIAGAHGTPYVYM